MTDTGLPKSKWANYVYNIFLSVDQLFNALLGGAPDESLSSRFGRYRARGLWFATICANCVDFVFLHLFGEQNHCDNALESVDDYEREIWK